MNRCIAWQPRGTISLKEKVIGKPRLVVAVVVVVVVVVAAAVVVVTAVVVVAVAVVVVVVVVVGWSNDGWWMVDGGGGSRVAYLRFFSSAPGVLFIPVASASVPQNESEW